MNDKKVVEIKNLVKRYGARDFQTTALKGIDLTIYKGDFIAIMGPSGSGKTTLLNILSTIDKPSQGMVMLDGQDVTRISVTIAGKTYRQTQRIMTPYLGYLQKELGCLYVVSDREYERLKEKNNLNYYICNYKLADNDIFDFEEVRSAFDTIVSNTQENYTARVSIDPYSNEGEWIKALHSLCIFMFLVFIVASDCIMFMKLYNDSFEETQRYAVLKKLGFSTGTLSASIAHELATAYLLPFAVMTVSAYFSVLSLGKMMRANLFGIYIVSMAVVSVVFVLFCVLSITVCQKTLLSARDKR